MGARRFLRVIGTAAIILLLFGCGTPTAPPTPVPTVSPTSLPTSPPAEPGDTAGLTDEQVATLSSLERVDEYPLYTMRYYGDYRQESAAGSGSPAQTAWSSAQSALPAPAWACSLFAALGDAPNMVYGRNFDWEFSPAVLLFTDPPDGYASVSMVDTAYLLPSDVNPHQLAELPLIQRRALLAAPFWPFDGLNEQGLAVGMAAVPSSPMPHDPDKPEIDSLMIIREMLDYAGDVDEAVALMQRHNIRWGQGPPLHYLIADASGRSVLVEFYEGEMVVLPNESPWHLATNHLRVVANETGQWDCWRYDRLAQRLEETSGRLTALEAMGLLEQVAQVGTQWSIVYGIGTGDINVAMGGRYDSVHLLYWGLDDE